MRFLVDQNLDESLAETLRRAGFEAAHTSGIEMSRAPDVELLDWCRAHTSVLLTADKKLSKYLAEQRAANPSVVIFRGYDIDPAQLEKDLLTCLPAIATATGSGRCAMFSVTRDKVTRFQYLPLDSVTNLNLR